MSWVSVGSRLHVWSQTVYCVPDGDFASFLVGTWRRNLEWRQFGGGFRPLKSDSLIIFVRHAAATLSRLTRMPQIEAADPPADSMSAEARYLKWCVRVWDADVTQSTNAGPWGRVPLQTRLA